MKWMLFLIPAFLIFSCSQPGNQGTKSATAEVETPQESSGFQIDDTYSVEEVKASDMVNWEFHGTGKVTTWGSQLLLSETEGSKGVILISPSSYGKNVVVSYDVMTLTPASVLVLMLSSSNNESLGLDIGADYDGNLGTLREEVAFYMIAYHNAPHNRFPFVNKYPKEGENLLQEAEKTFMHPGIYYHVEVGREGDRIVLSVDGQKVLDVVDPDSFPGGKIVFRARGTGHHSASCLMRNLKIYSKN